MKSALHLLAVGTIILVPACSRGPTTDTLPRREDPAGAPASIALAGRVTDAAQILTPEQEAGLSDRLAALERATTHQMVVATVPTLGGQDIAAYTTHLANRWGIGRRGHDDGVVLLVAPDERKVRIAVGRGLAAVLTDALCQQIIDERMLPRFRQGDVAGGIDAGLAALITRLDPPVPTAG